MNLIDNRKRTVNYLRLSVTDRCNLRCLYCAAQDGEFIPHPEILRYEEMTTFVGMVRELGVNKVRLTGGEPFARKGFAEFATGLLARFPGLDVRVTTNATLIGPHLPFLIEHGLTRLNISLDTLDRARFERITGRDLFDTVQANIRTALDLGFKVKINAVALKGVNDVELPAFLELVRTLPLDVRFIEFMPMGGGSWSPDSVWTAEEIREAAERIVELSPLPYDAVDHGPARMYAVAGGRGRLGIISPLTDHFCATCNRLRLTADGRLRTCLFSDKVYRLKNILRNEKLGIEAVRKVLLLACKHKPLGYELLQARKEGKGVCGTPMSAIGG